ncbi:MAG: hypothetical protein U0802_11135 [Candidatus Binatia bacterium]
MSARAATTATAIDDAARRTQSAHHLVAQVYIHLTVRQDRRTS